MPEPDEGIDYYIYKHIVNPIATKTCFLSPNFVTTLGILLTLVLSHNIVYSGCKYRAIFLALLIQLLDCLDGAIARKCNKKTELGALYDIAADTIKNIMIFTSVILYNLRNKINIVSDKLIWILFISGLELSIQLINELKGKRSVDDTYFNDKKTIYGRTIKFTHDNTMLIVAILIIIIKTFKY